jgi:selenocysteine lyase/cysteine desulfurase
VDAAQLAPHRRIDIAADDVDYLAFSGHKLYAPFGAGVLMGRPDWLDAGTPHLAGGGAVHEARLDGVSWATGPARHEGGSPNVLGAATLARATQVIAALDRGAVARPRSRHPVLPRRGACARSTALFTRSSRTASSTCRQRPGAHARSASSISRWQGYDAGLVAAYLSAEHGVGPARRPLLRAPAAPKRLGLPSGSLRASFGVGSRLEDAQRLLAGIQELRRTGLGWDYVVDAGTVGSVERHPQRIPHWAPNTPWHCRRRPLHAGLIAGRIKTPPRIATAAAPCGKFGR